MHRSRRNEKRSCLCASSLSRQRYSVSSAIARSLPKSPAGPGWEANPGGSRRDRETELPGSQRDRALGGGRNAIDCVKEGYVT